MTLYRFLLRLYPASFRATYGAEMSTMFAKRRRETAGVLTTLWLWVDAVSDIVRNATLLHADFLRQDLRFTLRSLARARGFTLTAIVVAALGIGATTAVFSVTDHVLFKALPFPHSDLLVRL